jgi:hypothetical protein
MDQVADAEEGGAMQKVLNWFHVAMLGTGRVMQTVQLPLQHDHQDHPLQMMHQHPQ